MHSTRIQKYNKHIHTCRTQNKYHINDQNTRVYHINCLQYIQYNTQANTLSHIYRANTVEILYTYVSIYTHSRASTEVSIIVYVTNKYLFYLCYLNKLVWCTMLAILSLVAYESATIYLHSFSNSLTK